jgi:cytochrome bd ubiquinol oxidase subunit II
VTATTVGVILLAVLTLYVTFAGADFGAGWWDLLAGDSGRGQRARQLVRDSITPVWEANHVWLIFAIVLFWTAFPVASTTVWTAQAVPLWLAAFGIVLRGAAFAFLSEVKGRGQRALSVTFAASSLITPFFMGCVVGGAVTAHRATGVAAWTGRLSIACGFLFVSACTYLAAVYLVHESNRCEPDLLSYFVLRGRVSGVVTGALSLVALAALHHANRHLFDRLLGRALPLVLLAAGCGVLVLILLSRYPAVVRGVAWVGIGSVVWAWGWAQFPTLLPEAAANIHRAAAPHGTLVALLGIAAAALILVVPAFVLLFSLQSRQLLTPEDDHEVSVTTRRRV